MTVFLCLAVPQLQLPSASCQFVLRSHNCSFRLPAVSLSHSPATDLGLAAKFQPVDVGRCVCSKATVSVHCGDILLSHRRFRPRCIMAPDLKRYSNCAEHSCCVTKWLPANSQLDDLLHQSIHSIHPPHRLLHAVFFVWRRQLNGCFWGLTSHPVTQS